MPACNQRSAQASDDEKNNILLLRQLNTFSTKSFKIIDVTPRPSLEAIRLKINELLSKETDTHFLGLLMLRVLSDSDISGYEADLNVMLAQEAQWEIIRRLEDIGGKEALDALEFVRMRARVDGMTSLLMHEAEQKILKRLSGNAK